MPESVKSRLCFMQALGMMAVFLQGCGLKTQATTGNSCSANTAQIAVYDTQMERLCGCSESSGFYFGSGQSFNCTVTPGTTIYFNYIGIANSHQIGITGLTTFPVRSGGSSVTQVDAWPLNSSGTFTFRDYDTNIGGTLIVQ